MGICLVSVGTIYLVAVAVLARQRRESLLLSKTLVGTVWSALSLLASGTAYLQAAEGLPYTTPYKAHVVVLLCIPPMFRVCIELQGQPRRAQMVEIAMYVVWSVNTALTMATDWMEAGAVSLIPFVDRVGRFEQGVRVALTITLLWALVEMVAAYRATRGIRRRQVAYFLLGLAIYAGAGISFSVVALLNDGGAVDPASLVLFSVPWIGLTLYAASRYRLFEVRRLLSLIISGFVVVAAAVLGGWGLFALIRDHVAVETSVVLCTGLVAVPLLGSVRLRALVDSILQRIIGAPAVDEPEALDMLSTELSLDSLVQRIVGVAVRRFDALSAALYLKREHGGFAFVHGHRIDDPSPRLDRSAAISTFFEAQRGLFIVEEQELLGAQQLVAATQRDLAPMAVEVCAPLTHGPRIEGLLVLGAKSNRESFTKDELEWLSALCGRASLALENVRLYAALEEAMVDLDAFVRSAAHDLRTPLRAIDNLTQFAEQDLEANAEALPGHLAASASAAGAWRSCSTASRATCKRTPVRNAVRRRSTFARWWTTSSRAASGRLRGLLEGGRQRGDHRRQRPREHPRRARAQRGVPSRPRRGARGHRLHGRWRATAVAGHRRRARYRACLSGAHLRAVPDAGATRRERGERGGAGSLPQARRPARRTAHRRLRRARRGVQLQLAVRDGRGHLSAIRSIASWRRGRVGADRRRPRRGARAGRRRSRWGG